MLEVFDVLNPDGTLAGQTAQRDDCHQNGLWHRAVVLFVINSKNQVLLQKRSAYKKMWPNLWDVTAGGHVLTGEFGFEAVLREAREELQLELNQRDLLFLGSDISTNKQAGILDNHFNEFFVATKEVDLATLKLQEDEVQEIKWFEGEEVIRRMHDNYDELTTKTGCWEALERYLNRRKK